MLSLVMMRWPFWLISSEGGLTLSGIGRIKKTHSPNKALKYNVIL
jgi:hypothetical protein